MAEYKYKLEGLDCAHCAAKIEEKIANRAEYKNVSFVFATKILSLDAEGDTSALREDIQKIVDSVEDGVTVVDINKKKNAVNRKFKLEGLGCAHCAAKIEEKIANRAEYKNVSFVFATKVLSLDAEGDTSVLREDLQKIVDSVEDGVTVVDLCEEEKHEEHEHSHEHGHGDSNEIRDAVIRICIAVLVFAATWFLHRGQPDFPMIVGFLIGTLEVGYPMMIKGIKSLFKLRLDENMLMLVAVVAAFCIGEYAEAALVTLLFATGEMLEDIAVGKSRRDIEKLAQIRPDTALLSKDGELAEVPVESIRVGDLIVVKPFSRVPLDGVVVDGASSIDTSAITGESVPVAVEKGNEVMSGSINCDGMLTLKTTNSYEESTASRILKLVEESAVQKGSSEKFITKFAKVYTPVVVLAAILLAAIPSLIYPAEFSTWLMRALVFLVASCPCAIVISVPLGFYSGIGLASKNGILIKGGKYIEALSKADTVIFDKTGTLTIGKPAVTDIKCVGDMTREKVLALAAAVEKFSEHPIAKAIKEAAEGYEAVELSDYAETPAMGTRAIYDGHTVECGGIRILTPSEHKKYADDSDKIFLVVAKKVEGIIELSDRVREESAKVCAELKNNGIKKLVMLTGDNEKSASRVAEQCGLDEHCSALLPQDKVEKAKQIKENSASVIFVGDGINDAPVLTLSDCGIAMGLGSEAAIESADAVLSENSLKKLPAAIKLAKKALNTVKFNIVFAIAVKLLVLVLAAFGYAPMWLAVFADTGVALLCILNSARLLKTKIK